MNKRLSLSSLFVLLMVLGGFQLGISQQGNPLPKGLAPEEISLIPAYRASRATAATGYTTPPAFPVRTMAEWEEIEYLVVNYRDYRSTVREIIRYAVEEVDVLVVTSDSNNVKTELTNAGIPLTRLHYLQIPSNSIWIRDYGANTVYRDEVDTLKLVEWIYNRPRPLDDQVPVEYANYLGVDLYSNTTPPYDLVHTGGNFHIDGFGTAFSSNLILDENAAGGQFNPTNKTEPEIDSLMKDFMGINRYIKMPVLPYDAIHHIDMHMRLLDEETILVGEYPTNVADGPQIEANLLYIQNNFNSVWGTPYKIIRIQMPPDFNGNYPDATPWWNAGDYRTYTNSVFVNKTMLVPIYEPQYDTTALRILRESMPGYKVIGIDCNSIIGASGALHCITRAVGVRDPLLIAHQSLEDTYDDQNPFPVDAWIKHRSGISSANLFYTTDTTQGYTALPMTLTNASTDTWSASIPAQSVGTEVFYYVQAIANSGKVQVRPMPAPEGYWNFEVLPVVAVEDPEIRTWGIDPVFPNPARAITCIPVHSSASTLGRISLTDLYGREVQEIHNGEIPAGESKYFFFADQLAAGVYLVLLEGEMGKQVQKVMVR